VVGELATTITPGSLSGFLGVAMNGTGTEAVAAMGVDGIWVIDLSTPAVPVVRGTYDTSGWAQAVVLNSTATLAYVADGLQGFKILSLSNPSAPTLVGSLSFSANLRDVAVAGSVAYLVNQNGQLITVNVSTPSAPQQLATYAPGRYVFHVAVEGTRAVLIESAGASDYLDVLDITNPASPVSLSATVVGGAGATHGVALVGGRAYLAADTLGLVIYDLTNPAVPVLRGQGYTVGAADGVAVAGTSAFVADTQALISVVDLFTP